MATYTYSREALSEIHEDIESFAKSESLTAHANSIAVRFEGEEYVPISEKNIFVTFFPVTQYNYFILF